MVFQEKRSLGGQNLQTVNQRLTSGRLWNAAIELLPCYPSRSSWPAAPQIHAVQSSHPFFSTFLLKFRGSEPCNRSQLFLQSVRSLSIRNSNISHTFLHFSGSWISGGSDVVVMNGEEEAKPWCSHQCNSFPLFSLHKRSGGIKDQESTQLLEEALPKKVTEIIGLTEEAKSQQRKCSHQFPN
jgi:hypothetical protein